MLFAILFYDSEVNLKQELYAFKQWTDLDVF